MTAQLLSAKVLDTRQPLFNVCPYIQLPARYHTLDSLLSPLNFTEMDTGAENAAQQRSNFIDILEHLDPLPELRETGEFFNRDVLDFQYSSAPIENPFPTWGSVSSTNLAAMGASAASAVATASTATATPTTNTPVGTIAAGGAPVLPSVSATKKGSRCSLQDSSQVAAAGAGAPDRHVFLRQRLGGESVSSGNSSTSTSSDNGSASDDTAATGEWGTGGGTESSVGVAVADGAAGAAVGSRTTKAPGKAMARRKRHRRSSKSKGGSRKAGKREGGGSAGASERADSGSGRLGRAGGYASWATLVRPLKQQWDHVEPPAAATANESTAIVAQSAEKSLNSGCCCVFSTEPHPCDSMFFSVEQCSAQAHTTAVASYILRVRCASGAHIIRRTWDDIAALCTMLRRHFSSPAGGSNDSTAGSVGGADTIAGTASGAAAAPCSGLEFAPADVVAVDAASGFLKDLLLRPGMASVAPLRRFLELEFLDGTIKGVTGDGGREKAAREVASMAASAAASAAVATGVPASATPFVVPLNMFEPTGAVKGSVVSSQVPGLEMSVTQLTAPTSGVPVAPALGLRLESAGSRLAAPGCIVPAIPAHPDAARDLAAVCRCLGELGAAAFLSTPRGAGSASPYWEAKDAATSGPGFPSEEAGVGIVAPQRGFAVVA